MIMLNSPYNTYSLKNTVPMHTAASSSSSSSAAATSTATAVVSNPNNMFTYENRNNMMLMMSQYDYLNQIQLINKNLESCLAIDCNLNGQYSSNSISSCSSTSSSATSIVSFTQHANQDVTLQPEHCHEEQPLSQHQCHNASNASINTALNSYQSECEPMRRFNHKNGMLLKHVKASFSQHECSSGDEGYVGSYSSSTSDNRLLIPKSKHSPHVDSEPRTTTRPFVHQMSSDIVQDNGAVSESNNKSANLNRLLHALQANLNESTGHTLSNTFYSSHERAKCLDAIAKDMMALEGYDLSIYDNAVQYGAHMTPFIHVNSTRPKEEDDEYNDDIANMNEFVDLEYSSLEECEPTQCTVKIEIPNNLFAPNGKDESLEGHQGTLDTPVFFKLHDEDKFDIAYTLSLNEPLVTVDETNSASVQSMHTLNECVCTRLFQANEAETKQLKFELFTRQVELEQLEELEMYGQNWRVILEQRRDKESKERQLAHEDHVDVHAYLNEIQMNVDYYQADVCDESTVDLAPLRFRANEMAFNLRLNHQAIEQQRQLRREQQQQRKVKRVKSLLYANFDSIPEFVMPCGNEFNMNKQTKSKKPVNTLNDASEDCNEEMHEEEQHEHETHDSDDYTLPIYADDENVMFMGDEAHNYFDSTICGDESDNNNNKANNRHPSGQMSVNNNNNHDTTLCVDNEFYTNEAEHLMFDQCEGEYAYHDDEHMFYDEQFYEDQVYIESLSDEQVLTLLRKESELYALKMSQASKTGLLNNQTQQYEPEVEEFVGSQFLPVDSSQANLDTEDERVTELDDEFVPQLDELTNEPVESIQGEYQMPSSEDMFENVYSHYQPNEFHPMYHDQAADPEDFAHVNEMTGSDEVPSYETHSATLATNEFDQEFLPSEEGHASSDHQMSLRNSLLRLRQSRRHLEHLIEQSKMANSSESATASCSSASSTTGSFRTGSSMSLYKQHMLNMSKKPCVYILNEGRCMRSDCRFVHDLKSITCKYWLEGECLKGESCEFAHEVIHEVKQPHGNKHKHGKQQTSSKKAAELVKKDFKLDSEEFPALGAAPVQTAVQSIVQNEKQNKESSPSASTTPTTTTTTTTTATKACVDNAAIPISQTSPQKPKASIANIVKQQQPPVKTIASVLLSNVVSSKSQANASPAKTLSNIVKTPAVNIAQADSKSLTLNNTIKPSNNNNSNSYSTKVANTPSGSENVPVKSKKNKKSQQKELLSKQTSNSRTNSCTRKK